MPVKKHTPPSISRKICIEGEGVHHFSVLCYVSHRHTDFVIRAQGSFVQFGPVYIGRGWGDNQRNMAVTCATLFLTLAILSYFAQICDSETTVPWYESLPAVAMDYKVHIDPGKEDCYFQYVNPGATFYVSFQVRNHIGTTFII